MEAPIAHKDIAVHFSTWLSPAAYLYLIKEFQRLKDEESQLKNLKWHVSKITNNIDAVRNLLDTIPGQNPNLNRIGDLEEDQASYYLIFNMALTSLHYMDDLYKRVMYPFQSHYIF